MRLLAVVAFAALCVAACAAEALSLDVSTAEVTRDVGGQGNVSYGNLPDAGDQVGWTLPDDFTPGVYSIAVDGRTGSRGEGTGFVAGYRVTVPDGAFAQSDEPHEIALHWPGATRPRVKSKGEGYSVFQGEMPARELAFLRPGDVVRVHGGSGWCMAWKLILRPVAPPDQVALSVAADALASIFTGDEAAFEVRVTNWRDRPVQWAMGLRVTDLQGESIDASDRKLSIPARSVRVVSLSTLRKRYGPLWANVSVSEGAAELARAARGFCFSPAPDPQGMAAQSPFGIHKSDLSEWPAIGAKWVRLWDTGDTWNRYEKERGKIDWAPLDDKVRLARRRGVEILYVFAYTPTWASARPRESHYTGGGARAEPADIEDWKRFVSAVVGRYKGRVEAFEIWNEPNAGFFSGTVDAYVELLKAGYAAAKQANPDCTVLGISGTGGYLGWMEEVLKRDGLRYMDAVSVHTYTTPRSPEQANLLGRMASTRALIEKYGGEHPIWNTEVGIWQPEREGVTPLGEAEIAARAPDDTKPNWNAGWPYRPISELEAARHCVRTYVLSLASGVQRLFWYAWYPTAMPMFTADASPRLMAVSYSAMVARLNGADFVRRISLGTTDANICLFTRGTQALAVAWTTRPEGRKIRLGNTGSVEVFDMWGNSRRQEVSGIDISPSPVYIEGVPLAQLEKATLAGVRLVFESVAARVTRDVGAEPVKEHTSAPHHGDRRVMGLPDAGDEITWTIEAIDPALYRIELDGFTGWRQPANHVGDYALNVRPGSEAEVRRITLGPDPDRPAQKVGDTRYYGVMVADEVVHLAPGAQISVSKSVNWGFVGALTLLKVAEAPVDDAIACLRLAAPLALDADASDWPDVPPLAIDRRKQAVIGVADPFASTDEHDSWKGPGDLSGKVRVAWEPGSLWVLVQVTDDILRPEPDQAPYQGDCVELFIDLRETGEVGSPVMSPEVYQVFCVAPGGSEQTPVVKGKAPEGARFAGRKTQSGWVLEGRIPLQDAGLGSRPRARLGFDVALDDADNSPDGPARRKTQMVWHGTANNFEDPSVWGELRLQDQPTLAAE